MKKAFAYLALALVLALMVLVLLSWLLSATIGEGIHSLLSSEGIRFFFGGYVDMVRQPLLVWMLLVAMAWGSAKQSGIQRIFHRPIGRRQRQAIVLLMVLLTIYVGVMLMLTAVPHAVLLSATGRLWPSAFSRALVPIVAFGLILLSVVYGIVSRKFLSFTDVCQSFTHGMASATPLLLLYILLVQLWASIRFVFEL